MRIAYDADEWKTVKPNGPQHKGQPVKIGENGVIKAGMGGKFNGKKLSEIPRKRQQAETQSAKEPKAEAKTEEVKPTEAKAEAIVESPSEQVAKVEEKINGIDEANLKKGHIALERRVPIEERSKDGKVAFISHPTTGKRMGLPIKEMTIEGNDIIGVNPKNNAFKQDKIDLLNTEPNAELQASGREKAEADRIREAEKREQAEAIEREATEKRNAEIDRKRKEEDLRTGKTASQRHAEAVEEVKRQDRRDRQEFIKGIDKPTNQVFAGIGIPVKNGKVLTQTSAIASEKGGNPWDYAVAIPEGVATVVNGKLEAATPEFLKEIGAKQFDPMISFSDEHKRKILKETDKAIAVESNDIDGGYTWIPKSQAEIKDGYLTGATERVMREKFSVDIGAREAVQNAQAKGYEEKTAGRSEEEKKAREERIAQNPKMKKSAKPMEILKETDKAYGVRNPNYIDRSEYRNMEWSEFENTTGTAFQKMIWIPKSRSEADAGYVTHMEDWLFDKLHAEKEGGNKPEKGRKYLKVKYADKDQAKSLGAKWDPDIRAWYRPGDAGDVPKELEKKVTNKIRGVKVTADMALDATSLRSFDANGFMQVPCNITKEQVVPYRGHEIPGWREIGLDSNEIYYAYRPAEEIERAKDTFNGVPIMLNHHTVNSSDPKKHYQVGNVGTSASFESPYLRNILTFTDEVGINAVRDGLCRELSAAYQYRPDFTAGEFEGVPYDFVIRDMKGNHVAIVEKGRAGADVVVSDSAENLKERKGLMAKVFDFFKGARDESPEAPEEEKEMAVDGDALIEEIMSDIGESMDEIGQKYVREKLERLANGKKSEIEVEAKDEDEPTDDQIEPPHGDLTKAKPEGEEDVIEDNPEPQEPMPSQAPAIDAECEEAFKATARDESDKEAFAEGWNARGKKDEVSVAQDSARHVASIEERYRARDAVKHVLGNVDPMAYDSADALYSDALKAMGLKPSKGHAKAVYEAVSTAKNMANDNASVRKGKYEGAFAGFNNIRI